MKIISNISGFPEFATAQQLAFNKLLDIIRHNFEMYGFVPLDTAVVEKVSTLLAKGNDNEIYGIHRLTDVDDQKDMGLRFDLTVPLARYVAQNYGNITFPYRRYHIAPVWRGERPQSGRYRQFYQCDIDILDENILDITHDAELVKIIQDIFYQINIDNFTIKLNNRNILSSLIMIAGADTHKLIDIMRIIDKTEKITAQQMHHELNLSGLNESGVKFLTEIIYSHKTNNEWIIYLKNFVNRSSDLAQAVADLEYVLDKIKAFGVDEKHIQVSPTLARGLNYYTGTVYETILNDFPELGSICSGGRYDNLVSGFSKKHIPGVGISIGISRLFTKMLESRLIDADKESVADVLVTTQDHDMMDSYINIAQLLRQNNIKTELFISIKSLGAQLKYASKKSINYVVLFNREEYTNGVVTLRNIQSSTQQTISIHDLISAIKHLLSDN